MNRSHFTMAVFLPFVLLGCGGEKDRVEITETMERSSTRPEPKLDASSEERFQMARAQMPMASPAAASEGPPTYHWTAPEGWVEQPSTEFRMANFTFGPEGAGEAYLTVLPGGGGGALMNVNRWRSEMELDPVTGAELDQLPQVNVLGRPAYMVDITGAYKGANDQSRKEGYRTVGLLFEDQGAGVFIKMVGPEDVVADELENFEALVTSLHSGHGHTHDEVPEAAASATAGEPALDDEAELPEGHPPIGGLPEGHPPVGELPEDHPPVGDLPAGHPDISNVTAQAQGGDSGNDGGGEQDSAAGLTWTTPKDWNRTADRPMRAVTFTMGEDGQTECYISVLGGTAGGLEPNVNRWLGQFGQEPLSQEELAALPKIELFGDEVALIEAKGPYTGMGGETKPYQALLGAAHIDPSGSVFVKMIGPAEEVAGQKDAFIAFCNSLEKTQQ